MPEICVACGKEGGKIKNIVYWVCDSCYQKLAGGE